MTEPISNNTTLRALQFALDGLSVRQRATAHNIANVDTPGYKAQHVSFEDHLQRALQNNPAEGLSLELTDSAHLDLTGSQAPAIEMQRESNQLRNDENNVDIDLEMTNLAQTTIRYQALSQISGMKFALLRSIIREGR
ncbi:MAG: flagellar basal body rod protein FlgB [Anaerolineae bacterium]